MTLSRKFAQMPRAARWGLVALAAFAAYFVLVEPALDLKSRLDARAAAASTQIATYSREGSGRAQAADAIRRGQERFDDVAFPGEGDQAAEALNKAVNAVLDEANVGPRTLRSRSVPLTQSPLERVLRPGEKLERRIVDIQFDAPPETASAVLAALERRPEVAAVTRVQLDRAPQGRALHAILVVETWARVRKEAR